MKDITKSNPFQTTIPPPPENPLAFNRSKSNPVSIDLLGLDTPSTNVVPNENENKKQTANPQPNPDLINDNVAYLLEKKESSKCTFERKILNKEGESSEEEAHSHSHSDLDVEDQEFESIGYSHLNSRHQKKRDTKIRVSAEDIDLFDQDIQSPTIPENQHSPVFSNLNNKNPFIQAKYVLEKILISNTLGLVKLLRGQKWREKRVLTILSELIILLIRTLTIHSAQKVLQWRSQRMPRLQI